MPADQFPSAPPAERPRSGVRVLLGLPADKAGNRPTTGKLTIPAGLRYGQSPLPGWGKRDSEREGQYERDEQDSWEEWSIEEVDGPGPDALYQSGRSGSQEQLGRAAGLSHAATPQGTPAPASGSPTPADVPTADAGQPRARLERTNLEMPGVSTRRQDFPALSRPENTAATRLAGRDQAETSGLERFGSPDPSASPTLGTTTLDADRLDRLERLVAAAEAGHRGESRTPQVSERATSRPVSAADDAEAGRGSSASHPPVEQTSIQRLDRVNQDLAAQLEQLRRMMGELATTAAPQPAQQPDTSQPRDRPVSQPAQRVVIVKRPPPFSRTPRAFWERSYLSRVSLRSVR